MVTFRMVVAASAAATGVLALGPEDLLIENMPDASVDGEAAATAWARSLPAIGESQWSGPRMASPEQWNDLGMYQIFIDRFNNGDASNDNANMEAWQADEMSRQSYENVHLYHHGGDLKGIINRLDYIQSLGLDIVFVTSFLYNREGMFHGYCVSNHLQVDPSFGTLEDLQMLTREAHHRGMYVVMDFVVNHICDPNTSYRTDGGFRYPEGDDHAKCTTQLFDAVENLRPDNNIQGRGELNFGDTFFPPLKRQEYFSRCGKGLTEDLGGAKYSDFVSWMFDFQTTHPQVHFMLAEMAKYWIAAADVDGFRLDATKHVSDSLAPYFAAHVRDYANKLGKDNFYIIGEVVAGWDWQARQTGTMEVALTPATAKVVEDTRSLWSAHPTQAFPGFTAVYDFAHGGTVRSIARGEATPTGLEGVLNDGQRQTLLANADDNQFWTLVDQHDWKRLLQGDEALRHNAGVVMSAYGYLFTARGIPHVYYGTEQGFNGDCWWFRNDGSNVMDLGSDVALDRIRRHCSGDKSIGVPPFETHGDPDALYRQTMWVGGGYALGMADRSRADSLVNIHEPRGANPFNWMNDPFLVENPISSLLKKLTDIRRSCPALRRGLQFFRRATDDGLVAFARKFYNQEIVIAVNMRSNSVSVGNLYMSPDVVEGAPTNRYLNLLNTDEVATVGWNGQFNELRTNMNLCGHCVAIFVREDFVDTNPDPRPTPFPTPAGGTGTKSPSTSPSTRPTASPQTSAPSASPQTPVPTASPLSGVPTTSPSVRPTASPSVRPTLAPSASPVAGPPPPTGPPLKPCEAEERRRRLQKQALGYARCLLDADVGVPAGVKGETGEAEPNLDESPVVATPSSSTAVVAGVGGAVAFVALAAGLFVARRRSRQSSPAAAADEEGAVVSANPMHG